MPDIGHVHTAAKHSPARTACVASGCDVATAIAAKTAGGRIADGAELARALGPGTARITFAVH